MPIRPNILGFGFDVEYTFDINGDDVKPGFCFWQQGKECPLFKLTN
ncbi:hypothetical protein EMIT013CA1_30410 [Bacillus sp. IT-13CA1]